MLLAAGCSLSGRTPEPVQPESPIQGRLVPVAIVFEPALAQSGRLTVRHESGWATEVDAPPSGVDFAMPEGPASLVLEVGGRRYERTLKVGSREAGPADETVWRLLQ